MYKSSYKTGADVNENKCRNPLREVACEGRKVALKLLIEKGADVNMPYDTDTALLAVVTNDHYKCMDMLLKAGADVNADISCGKTTLFMQFSLKKIPVTHALVYY